MMIDPQHCWTQVFGHIDQENWFFAMFEEFVIHEGIGRLNGDWEIGWGLGELYWLDWLSKVVLGVWAWLLVYNLYGSYEKNSLKK